MNFPIIGIGGQAGVGKDTVAEMLLRYAPDTYSLAQADPLKQLAFQAFGFTEEQLWGPSACRNAVDERFNRPGAWYDAHEALFDSGVADGWLSAVGVGDRPSIIHWFNLLERSCAKTGLSPRILLQLLGTEWGRNLRPDVWSSIAIDNATKLLGGGYTYHRTTGLKTAPDSAPASFVLITDLRFVNEVLAIKRVGGAVVHIFDDATSTSTHASEKGLAKVPSTWWTTELHNTKQSLEALATAVDRMYKSALHPVVPFFTA